MNRKNVQQLLESCGFVMWQDETWKPHSRAMVDWNSDYDAEVHLLIHKVAQTCADLCVDHTSRKSIISHFKL